MQSGNGDKPIGNLLKYRNISEEDIDLYLALITNNSRYRFLLPLRDIVDDDQKFLQILDLFAGTRMWFPDRIRTYRYLERATTYNYLKDRNFSPDAYKTIAKQIDKRVTQTKSLMTTIEATLEEREKDIRVVSSGVQKELESRNDYLDSIDSYDFDFTEED
jgi:hypothetical protein